MRKSIPCLRVVRSKEARFACHHRGQWLRDSCRSPAQDTETFFHDKGLCRQWHRSFSGSRCRVTELRHDSRPEQHGQKSARNCVYDVSSIRLAAQVLLVNRRDFKPGEKVSRGVFWVHHYAHREAHLVWIEGGTFPQSMASSFAGVHGPNRSATPSVSEVGKPMSSASAP